MRKILLFCFIPLFFSCNNEKEPIIKNSISNAEIIEKFLNEGFSILENGSDVNTIPIILNREKALKYLNNKEWLHHNSIKYNTTRSQSLISIPLEIYNFSNKRFMNFNYEGIFVEFPYSNNLSNKSILILENFKIEVTGSTYLMDVDNIISDIKLRYSGGYNILSMSVKVIETIEFDGILLYKNIDLYKFNFTLDIDGRKVIVDIKKVS